MRNLKRVLSLALAMIMVLGLMVISSSAASANDFVDADKITYTEAVDVLSALGIIVGDDNGVFNPDGILTREGAAKIICYMLMGPDNAEKLVGANVFTDVAADRWSAGYISYCASLGIIAGNGDGTFNPNGKLTGVAFAKLLLVALGNDPVENGYVGNNWSTNIAVDAIEAGLDIRGVALSAPLTREQGCQMALQALNYTPDAKTYYSVYNGEGASYDFDNQNDALLYAYLLNSNLEAGAAGFQVSGPQTDNTGSLGDKLYGLDSNPDTDAFGAPITVWTADKVTNFEDVEISTEPVATYTAEVTLGTLYSKLGLKSTSTNTTLSVIVDGENREAQSLVSGSRTAVTGSGNGVLTKIYANGRTGYIAVVINTYVATIDTYTEAVTNNDGQVTTPASITLDADTPETLDPSFVTDDFTADDEGAVVLYTAAYNNAEEDPVYEIQSVTVPASAALTATQVNTTKETFVAGGKTYSYSANAEGEFSAGNVINKASKVVYFDDYGYVILVDDPDEDASVNYAVVLDYGEDGVLTNERDQYAKLVYADGTIATVIVTEELDEDAINTVVTWTEGTRADAGKIVLDDAGAVEVETTITKNVPAIGDYMANNKTVFLYATTGRQGTTYTAYTGISNVPTIEEAALQVVADENNIALFVYVAAAELSDTYAAVSDEVYIVAATRQQIADAEKNTIYYVYSAVINGVITTIETDESIEEDVLYSSIVRDDNGLVVVDSCTMLTGSATITVIDSDDTAGTTKAANGVVVLGGTGYTYTDDTAVYVINGQKVTASSVSAITTDENDTFVGYTVNNVLAAVFITKVNP